MMTINVASLRASLGDALSANGNAASGATAGDTAGFASLLRQRQITPPTAPAPIAPKAAAPKPPTQEPPPPEESSTETKAPQDAEAANRARAQLKFKARLQEPGPAVPRDPPAAPDTEKTLTAAADKPTAPDDAHPAQAIVPEPTIDPGTLQWLAGLQRAVSGQSDDVERDAGAKASATGADAPLDEARGPAKGQRPTDLAADLAAESDLKEKVAQGRAQLADAAGARQFAGVLAEQRRAEAPAQPLPASVDRTHDTAPVNAAALAPAPTAGTAAAPAQSVPIAAPVNAPDFAHELGLRLAVLAKDGVQTAELHLNPAEMGPVSVQIVMDGTQARVDFGADMAATRQAIEAGLPELASALADAGFTLAGGGVSQHAGGRGGGGNEPGTPQRERARGMVMEDEVKRVATAAQRVVTRGGVDLFV